MTITRTTEDTVIKEGQWVHGASSLTYGLHSEPRQVTRFAGQRVHYRRQDGTESFMLKSAVLIVCDTEAEAEQVYNLSVYRDRFTSTRVDDVLRAINYEYEGHLNELIKGAAC